MEQETKREKELITMREITLDDYLEFVEKNRVIKIDDQEIELGPLKIERLSPQADELTDISTTVWSFPKRGAWATHRGNYRGNWAPQIPRALIEMYTSPGDLVVDPMVGGGTTIIEAKLLGRNFIGVDINLSSAMLSFHRLYYLDSYLREIYKKRKSGGMEKFWDISDEQLELAMKSTGKIYHGDARSLDKIYDESVDLIATHPPYFNIIKYGRAQKIEGDLSKARNLEQYVRWMEEIARELYRILKPGKYCAILIGDTRKHKHYVPISHYILNVFLKTGFILKEEVIKIQHKMKTTREVWSKARDINFLLIKHEKLYIFRKPTDEKEERKYKYSSRVGYLPLLSQTTLDQT